MTADVSLSPPWLEMKFPRPLQVMSWTLNMPGLTEADRILWREVSNADLPPDFDVRTWLEQELRLRNAAEVPCFLTSRNIRRFVEEYAEVEGIQAHAVVTLGLSNGERVGQRMNYSGRDWGTINIAVECSLGLSPAAMLEAISIVTQARTAALMEHGPQLPTGQITGTGTDCIAVAAPAGDTAFAGLHTPQAEAIGRAAYNAIARSTKDWRAENRHRSQIS